ncbi:Sodium/hydrogen exchanger 2 [Taenia crassiceps]|uniref:Sodium/hydrogen exchanger n=1 Tax=Taenia crassiceps TaxID=6207 RepID=A0ABR4Q7K8_9CEST
MGTRNTTMGGFNESCFQKELNTSQQKSSEIALVGFKPEELTIYLTVTLFMLVVMLLKLGYRKVPHLGSYFPESLLLMLVGLAFGAIIRYTDSGCTYANTLRLSPNLFFTILLPPIMLESAYSIYNKKFGEIFSTILFFAVIGTVLNFLLIGLGLYVVDITIGLGEPNLYFGIKEFFLFSSLIVAVDPVAVLAIFQDIGVDLNLYYMVFGESLLNDAVTVVLYNIMSAFVASPTINGWQIAVGIGSFFTVSLGGAMIGLLHGIFSCFLTRFSVVSETIGILLASYLAYIVADLFAWSGIISIIVCGVFQSAYAFHNLTPLAAMVLESAVEQVASIAEAIIFLLLGSEVFALNLRWHAGFLITSLLLCVIVRFVVTGILSVIVNKNRSKQTRISWSEQVIISYGGLRGAVAFSLAVLINAESLGDGSHLARDVQVTAAIAVIFFTVAVMGTTIKPLVRLLNIRLHSDKDSTRNLFLTLNDSVLEDILIFIEELISSRGVHSFVRALSAFDDKYIRPILQRDAATHEMKIVNAYAKLALKMHSEAIGTRGSSEPKDSSGRTERCSEEVTKKDDTCVKIIPDILFPSRLPSTRNQRRLTLAALSSIGPEVAYGHVNNINFASAQRAQFAKLSRTQATFARTMDLYARQHESMEAAASEESRRRINRHRGQLIRQVAKCTDSEINLGSRLHELKPFSHQPELKTNSISLTTMQEEREASDDNGREMKESRDVKSKTIDL